MAIIRYRPFSSSALQMFEEMNNLINQNRWSDDSSTTTLGQWNPYVDVKEEKNAYKFYVELPGVDPDKTEITVTNNVMTIKGEKKLENREETGNYSRIERFSGSFCRQFSLPESVEAEAIKAISNHGVLEITVPKSEKKQARTIKIETQAKK